MIFPIIVKVIITLYALLMLFASIKEINSKNRLGNMFNIIGGIAILISDFLGAEYFKIISIIALLIFIITAIFNGLQNHAFHIKHHIARFIITILFMVLLRSLKIKRALSELQIS